MSQAIFRRAALAAALLVSGIALAAPLPRGDVKFVKQAASGGMAEVELGKLAQQKAMRDEVKQFATMMVTDHTKANEELKAIASANGVEVPATMDDKARKEIARLQKMSGGDFDREYMKHMLKDHEKDVKAFAKQSRSKTDNDVKAFAAKTLPTLRDHLASARATYDIAMSAKRTGSREAGSTRK